MLLMIVFQIVMVIATDAVIIVFLIFISNLFIGESRNREKDGVH
jgi:hypothetical protein